MGPFDSRSLSCDGLTASFWCSSSAVRLATNSSVANISMSHLGILPLNRFSARSLYEAKLFSA